MHSHNYRISDRDCRDAIVLPIVALFLLLFSARLIANHTSADGSHSDFIDDIIITEKARAAHAKRNVDLLFVGDSSCLMGFSGRLFEELVPPVHVYNLGTLSTLGLERFGKFCAAFARTHRVPAIVLMISPEMVRSGSFPVPNETPRIHPLPPEVQRANWIIDFDPVGSLATLLGLPTIKTQLLARVFEAPFTGAWGNAYGFPSGVREYMAHDAGSAIDPTRPDSNAPFPNHRGAAETLVTDAFKSQCERFRQSIPAGAKLLIALTPIPESSAPPGYQKTYRDALKTLQKYLHADAALIRLPPALPDHYFSTSTHLNPAGSLQYTHYVARELDAPLRASLQTTRPSHFSVSK